MSEPLDAFEAVMDSGVKIPDLLEEGSGRHMYGESHAVIYGETIELHLPDRGRMVYYPRNGASPDEVYGDEYVMAVGADYALDPDHVERVKRWKSQLDH